VRLAFAVAAHLEPEILIVDEVLAVGDARFQEKCLSKMKDESVNNGRTVIFVSHNMNAIKQLCSRTILLNSGQIEFTGNTNSVIDKYLRFDLTSNGYEITCNENQTGITSIKFLNEKGVEADALRTGETCVVDFMVRSPFSMPSVGIEFGLTNHFGNRVIFSNSYYIFGLTSGLHEGINIFKCTIPNLPLLAGKYALDIALYDEMALHSRLQYESNIGIVEVIENDVFKTGRTISPEWGEIFFPHHWSKFQ
jgi:lipopolysaccharide transport system ATP-binding protein